MFLREMLFFEFKNLEWSMSREDSGSERTLVPSCGLMAAKRTFLRKGSSSFLCGCEKREIKSKHIKNGGKSAVSEQYRKLRFGMSEVGPRTGTTFFFSD